MDLNYISDNAYYIIKYGILFILSIGFIVLIVTSMLVHDTHWIFENPRFFAVETLLMGFLTAIPIVFISYMRDGDPYTRMRDFFILFFKIVFIHITFQLSGVYSVLFPNSSILNKS
jgi:hypothetical protein